MQKNITNTANICTSILANKKINEKKIYKKRRYSKIWNVQTI